MLSAKPNNENHSCPVCGDALRSQGESYDLRDIFAMWSPLAFPEQVIQEHMVIGKCTALYACPTCKVETFLPQIIGLPSFYAAASAGEWGGGDAGGYYEVTKWDFDEALRDVKPGASLIELGCGPGNFLKMAVARGGQVVGIEFNPHAMSVARSQGLTVYDASGIHEQEQKSFDAAFSFHVLEHVSDPMGFLASMKEHVRPGGVIGVSVPNQDGPIRFIQPCPMNMPPHHATIVEGVRMLLPGHKLVIEGGRMTVSEYWRLSANRHPDLADLDYAEQVRRLRGVLEGSVRAHMVSDVPVGAFLSGGIDSTVLTALMASQSGARLRTFSVGYGDEGASLDETDVAARSAAFFGTEHTRVLVTGAEVRDRMMAVAAALDQPSVDGVNSYFVSGAAAGSVKVAISGTGGDESFAGYGWFHRMAALAPRLAGNRSTLERLVSNAATWPLKHLPGATATRALSRIRGRHDFLEAFSREYRIFGSYGARLLLAPDLLLDLHNCQSDRARAAMADQLPDADVIARVSALVLRGYTQNQLLLVAVNCLQSFITMATIGLWVDLRSHRILAHTWHHFIYLQSRGSE